MNGANFKKPSNIFKALMLIAPLATLSMSTFANDEAILKADPINVEGQLRGQQAPTDSELEYISQELQKQKDSIYVNRAKTKKYQKLQRTTEKLAEETENYLEEKAESEKVIKEYNKKIECLLEKKNTKECRKYSKRRRYVEDSVNTQEAAVAKSEAKAESTELGDIKAIAQTGLSFISAENGDLESGVNLSIKAEANIGKRFAGGLGFNYVTLENTDFCLSAQCGNAWNIYNPYAQNTIGRDQEYKKYGVEAYGKFFIIENERFRPYVGAGISYNRSSLEYTSNNNFAYYNSYLNANEKVEMSTVGATLSVGTEIKLTQRIGIIAEFAYAKAISVNVNNSNPFSVYVPGQQRLNDLAEDIENADTMNLFTGMLINF